MSDNHVNSLQCAEGVLGLQLALAGVAHLDLERDTAGPALAAALMKSYPFLSPLMALCGSGHFARGPAPVTPLVAIDRLGVSAVHDLAIGVGVVRAFAGAWSSLGRAPSSSWRVTIERAVVAELLTYEWDPTLAERVFVTALLTNVEPELIALLRALDPACAPSDGVGSRALSSWGVPIELSGCIPGSALPPSAPRWMRSVRSIVATALHVGGAGRWIESEIEWQSPIDPISADDVLKEARLATESLANLLLASPIPRLFLAGSVPSVNSRVHHKPQILR